MVDDSGYIKVESSDEHHNYHAVVAVCSALPAWLVQSDDDGKKVADEENRYIFVKYYERSAIIPWERHLVCCKTVSNDFLSVRGFVDEAHFMEINCWYSTEAEKLFPLIDGEESAYDAEVAIQKILLKAANNS